MPKRLCLCGLPPNLTDMRFEAKVRIDATKSQVWDAVIDQTTISMAAGDVEMKLNADDKAGEAGTKWGAKTAILLGSKQFDCYADIIWIRCQPDLYAAVDAYIVVRSASTPKREGEEHRATVHNQIHLEEEEGGTLLLWQAAVELQGKLERLPQGVTRQLVAGYSRNFFTALKAIIEYQR